MADLIYPGGSGITTVVNTDLEADDMTFVGMSVAGSPQQTDYTDIKAGIIGNPETLGGVTPASYLKSQNLYVSSVTYGGYLQIKYYQAQAADLSVSAVASVGVPAGAILIGALLRVDTAVTDDGGDDTWSAAYSTGATQSIVSGAAAAQNTLVNQFFDPNAATPITSDTTNITFTPNGGSFTAGAITAVVFAMVLNDLDTV